MTGAWGYRSYREHLSRHFPGRSIRKLCLQAGFSCPNIDGARGRGGCAYCNNDGFAPKVGAADLRQQWDQGRDYLRHRYRRVDGFIAYFQSFSNTYAPLRRLRDLYDPLPTALPECVGVSISTRPDCVPDPVLDLVAELSQRCYTCLELGLQSDRDALLRSMNRGHSVEEFLDAVARAADRKIECCAHVILGLPGEDEQTPERLGALLASLPVASIKIHNFHVMRGSALARAPQRFPAPDRERYLDLAARLIARLRPDQCLQRVLADAPDHILLSGAWCHDKQDFLRRLQARLHQRKSTATVPGLR